MSSSTVDEVERVGGMDDGRSMTRAARWMAMSLAVAVAAAVAGCAAPHRRAPVEDRTAVPTHNHVAAASSTAPAPSPAASDALPVKPPLPGIENAGKPGYYTVKPMDTLIRIGLDTGQSWRDLVKWNNLDNPNIIEVGQVLRVIPPGADPASAGSRPIASSRVEARALGTPPPAASAPVAAPPPTPQPPVVAALVPTPRDGDDSVNWSWPTTAPVGAGFDEARNKGLAFYGKAGDPVYASADGRVMYAGAGLPGYGNLVILKHNSNYLTAYAHNQTLLVKEDQPVRKGQKIAEMGSTDAERVELHFEIRKQGKPVDPAKLLPAR